MQDKINLVDMGKKAKAAARGLGQASAEEKNLALGKMAEALLENTSRILEENQKDMDLGREKGLSSALLDRLQLSKERIQEMAQGLLALKSLADPIGEIMGMWKRPNGLMIGKKRVPLGVVGIIYEARPNVTVDAAGLCLKTGNAVVLRGGSEAFYSNQMIADIISAAAQEAGLPVGSIQSISSKDRDLVDKMLKMHEYIDVLIPRGGAGLIQHVIKNATVPIIETGVGNCHTYVDCDGDLDMAEEIIINAKTQRPGVCNALETLLVHKEIAPQLLPVLKEKLGDSGVELRGCSKTRQFIPEAKLAQEADWFTEYLDLILAIKVVDSMEEAMDHINHYGSGHSEAIVTDSYAKSQRFLAEVDAAAVYVNTSTRFTDGFQFGYGAEIGISTQKLHARGPMGLEALTTIKYIVYGHGQIRS